MTKRFAPLAVAVALLSGPAAAQNPITYVDAILGGPDSNTVQQVGPDIFDVAPWVVRQEFGVGGSLLQFRPADSPDDNGAQELVTTIDGLQSGVAYNLYAFFWDDLPETPWFIDVSLNGGATPDGDFLTFNATTDLNNGAGPVSEAAFLPIGNLSDINGENARIINGETVDTTNTINLTLGVSGNDTTLSDGSGTNTDLFAAQFATVTATSSSLDVFIRNTDSEERVWYDGIGFQVAGGLVGDTNGDDEVDILDYNEIASRIGGPAVTPGSLGDVFGDGVVDLRDFAVWQANRTDLAVSGVIANVPEPFAAGLAVPSFLVVLGLRRRRR